MRIIKVISQLCDEWVATDLFDFFPDNYSDSSILNTIIDVMPRFEDTMMFCKLFDKWSKCDKYLFPIITEEGLCFTFNAVNINETVTNE